MSTEFDVIVVGAGAAGLAAVRELSRAGFNTLCVEARERIGGRILTVRDPLCSIPLELGPEFVHGRPPEIWEIIRAAPLAAYDCFERAVHVEQGKPQGENDAWLLADKVLEDMQQAAEQGPDRSFEDFLKQSSHPENAKQLASSYVEGFNAARKEVIGIASLAQDTRAADEIGGDDSFRILSGYDAVAKYLADGWDDLAAGLRLNSVVTDIEWRRGAATVRVRSALTGQCETVRARCVLVTVPLGVLQAEADAPGAIRFAPEPLEALAAARELRFGDVMRVVLRFRTPIWEENEELGEVGFLLSKEEFFPTWWTPLPVRAPVITGWSAGPRGERLVGQPKEALLAYALRDLSRVTRVAPERISDLLEAVYCHDWSSDPYSRGAYSYTPAGALEARARLARPIEETLFFAGEATETNGHSATVHGAIASGRRAAQQIREALAAARDGGTTAR